MLINIYQRGETKTMKTSSAWFMLTPGLVILFLFLAIPLLRVLFPSIFSGAYPFDAYVGFFQDEYYRKIFIRTVKIAVITTFVCMVGGTPTAYFISRCSKKWRGILLAASIFPMMTNSVIRSFAWINILGSNGIINKVLVGLGVVPKPLKLLYTDFHYHWFCVSVSSSDDRNSSRCYGKY